MTTQEKIEKILKSDCANYRHFVLESLREIEISDAIQKNDRAHDYVADAWEETTEVAYDWEIREILSQLIKDLDALECATV